MIGGSIEGEITVFYSKFHPDYYQKYNCHADQITQIRCSSDGKYLFTSGKDGVVLIFEVIEFYGKGKTSLSFASKGEQKNQK